MAAALGEEGVQKVTGGHQGGGEPAARFAINERGVECGGGGGGEGPNTTGAKPAPE